MGKVDLTDPEAVGVLFADARPDFVIHTAAERHPELVDEDPSRAWKLNVAATETIAKACAARGAFLLHISTDYVYDGTHPPYFPDSPVNPLNGYGTMKLEGEVRIASAKCEAAILRLSSLYGSVERLDESSVTALAMLLEKREPCAVEHWARRYPLHVDDAASGIEKILDARASRPEVLEAARTGAGLPIFLLSGSTARTKYEMLMTMAGILGIDASFARPDPSPPSNPPRPKDCRMDTALIETLGYKPLVEFETGLAGALAPFFRT